MQKIIKIVLPAMIAIMLLNGLVFIGLAVYKSIQAYIMIVQGKIHERPGVHLADALDGFLVAIFFLAFSMGTAKLFLPDSTIFKGYDLPWLKVADFSALKLILWEMLLTTLFVFNATTLILHETHLDWTILIIPGTILMLALAYKFLKQGH